MLYFAYGSNMNSAQMETRCPDAKRIGVAELLNHDFIVNGRGVATIVPSTGKVFGVLWEWSGPRNEYRLNC